MGQEPNWYQQDTRGEMKGKSISMDSHPAPEKAQKETSKDLR